MKSIKISLLLVLILANISPSDGFFQSMFHLGSRVSNCLPWSLWSPCFSTKSFTMLWQLPGYCYYNSYGQQFVANGGITVVEQAYQYLRRVNASSGTCGQCLYQISCSRQCNLYGPNVLPGQAGFTTQLCEDNKIDQTEACRLNLLATDGICHMWPPLKDVIQAPAGAEAIKEQVYMMQTTSCTMIGSECYCCCLPYVPDPETRRCRTGLVV